MVVRINPQDQGTRVEVNQDLFHIFGAARNNTELLRMLRTEVSSAACKMGTYGKPNAQKPVTIDHLSSAAIKELTRLGYVRTMEDCPVLTSRGLAIA